MIDLHAHVLPGIDDGPTTVGESVELVRAIAGGGVTTVVATPHVSFEFPNTKTRIDAAARALREALEAAGVAIELALGAEVEAAHVIERDDGELEALHLGGGPYLLVESPLSPAAGELESMVLTLQARGHLVVLAHPERCPAFIRRPERLERLVEAGVLCSVTAGSLAGRFGRTVRRYALDLLAGGIAHDVSSDAHDAVRRPPGLIDGIEAAGRSLRGVPGEAPRLTSQTAAAILAGARIPPARRLRTRRLARLRAN